MRRGAGTVQQCLLGMVAETTMRAGGNVDHAVRLARLAVADDAWMDDWSTPAAADVLRCAGKFDEAMTVLDSAVSRFAGMGDELGYCRLLTSRARGLIATGALARAEEEAHTAFAIAERNPWLPDEPRIAITLALVKAKLGKADEAQALLDGVGRAEVTGWTTEHYEFLYASGWTNIARDDSSAAVDDLFECGRVMTESGIHNPVLVPWWADAAIAAMLLLDRREPAVRALEMGREMVHRWCTPESAALLTMIEGLVTPSTALLTEAAERFAELPSGPWHAFAEFTLGRAHVATGNNATARVHLRNAIGLMLSCGQSQWVADTHRLLQLAGGRMRMRPGATYDVLSASERRVAEIAASGATNREIAGTLYVSLRTVETHLTRAYRKLGISGRSQLRAACGIDKAPR